MAPIGAPDTSKTGPAIAHSPRTASSCSRASPVEPMSASCSLSSRGSDSLTRHAPQGRCREHAGCGIVVEGEDGFAQGACVGWDNDAHLGHLSAAVRSGFVMDDHHVIEEQHAGAYGAAGAAGEVFGPGMALDRSSSVSR